MEPKSGSNIDTTYEAYAIGYFYGREFGNDEPGIAELTANGMNDHAENMHAFKTGYERGVATYCDRWEDEHDCSDAKRPCDDCLTSNLPVFDGE
jgi:hypothetical protein